MTDSTDVTQRALHYAQRISENLYHDITLPRAYVDLRNYTKNHFLWLKQLQDFFDDGLLDAATIDHLDNYLGQWRDHVEIPAPVRETIQKELVLSAERGYAQPISENLTPHTCRIILSLRKTSMDRYPLSRQTCDDGVLQKILDLLGCAPGSLQGTCLINAVINIGEHHPELPTHEIHRRARQAWADLMSTPDGIISYP